MLVDLTKALKDENGNDIKMVSKEKDKEGKEKLIEKGLLTVSDVVKRSLFENNEENKEEWAKNFALWRELKDMADFEFSAEEVKRILDYVKAVYPIMIWGQIVELFDPALLKR